MFNKIVIFFWKCYYNCINILEIDQAIHQKFITIQQLRLQLQFERKQILRPQRVIDRRYSLAQIAIYQSKISKLETNFDRNEYQSSVEALLDQYRTSNKNHNIQ